MVVWRWQSGWAKQCPPDLGWLQPSLIITQQKIPVGGFPEPSAGFMKVWWIEVLFSGIYLIGRLYLIVYATRKNKSQLSIIFSIILIAAGGYFYMKGMRMTILSFSMALFLFIIGLYQFIRRFFKILRLHSK